MLRPVLLALTCAASPAFADEIIGVEPSGAGRASRARPAAEPAEPPPPPPRRAARDEGHWRFGGSLYGGVGSFGGNVTVGYVFNRWTGIDLVTSYQRFDRRNESGEHYGPELDFILRAPNPTPVTPFVGVGPGFVKWRRAEGGEVFDDASSATANAFGGLTVALTRNFGLHAVRRQRVYLADAPRTYGDHATREPKVQLINQIGFQVVF